MCTFGLNNIINFYHRFINKTLFVNNMISQNFISIHFIIGNQTVINFRGVNGGEIVYLVVYCNNT